MNYNPLFISKIKKGNSDTFQELYNDLYPRLVSFAMNYIVEKVICDDIVQDVFLRFWEKRKELRINNNIKSLLYTSVKNACLNYLKKRSFDTSKVSEIISIENNRLSETYAMQEEVIANIYKAIDQLPEKCKEVMLLSICDNTVAEIKDKLSISENTVKYHKKKAYSFLRNILNYVF